MKQTMNYLSMAALVVMGAILAGCAKETPAAEKENIVTLSVSVGLPEDESTKALDIDYVNKTVVKTFSEGETIAVIYKSGESTKKAVSDPLPAGDYGKSATFEVPLISPNENSPIRIIYPAARAMNVTTSAAVDSDDATIKYTALKTQDGTLSTLASNFDLCTFDGALSGYAMPTSASLTNRLAILAYTLYDGKGTADKADDGLITESITDMFISDGINHYDITRSAGAGPIYVAIRPTSAANIVITAVGGANNYVKSLNGKTYAAGQFYNITNRMTKLASFKLDDSGTKKVVFAPGNLQATWDGSKWNWAFASNQWDYIGNNPGNTSIDGHGSVSISNVTVDLFGWVGASNSNWSGSLGTRSNAAMHGISNSTSTESEYTYGDTLHENLKSDWGDTIGSGWRTLTSLEWSYVLKTRPSGSTVNGTSDACYTLATINTDDTGVNGLILFPDGITVASDEATSWGIINGFKDGNTWDDATKCTSAQWAALAAKGCVFLPAAGYRDGVKVNDVGIEGTYWSSTSGSASHAIDVWFYEEELHSDIDDKRFFGFSVRLVREVE